MNCIIKVNNLFLSNYGVNEKATQTKFIDYIEFVNDENLACVFESGEQAQYIKHVLHDELCISDESIKILMQEKE